MIRSKGKLYTSKILIKQLGQIKNHANFSNISFASSFFLLPV